MACVIFKSQVDFFKVITVFKETSINVRKSAQVYTQQNMYTCIMTPRTGKY